MPKDVVTGLGQRIRERRVAKDMKQATLAGRAGISTSYLCELETTEGASPSAVVLQRIADVLDTSIPHLLNLPKRLVAATDGRARPPSLLRAKARYRMDDDEVELLNRIEYRGRRPQTEEAWFFLLEAIRRTVG